MGQNRKNKKSNKILLFRIPSVLLIALFLGGCIADRYISKTGKAFFYVGTDYLATVFAATCTVAVLGNALLSILAGEAKNKVMGIPLKIILRIASEGKYLLRAIILPHLSILLALLAFSEELYTTLSLLLIFDVGLILSASYIVWVMLPAESNQEKMIKGMMQLTTTNKSDTYIDYWFVELHKAIKAKDQNGINQYIHWINTVANDTHAGDSVEQCIERRLPETFVKACESYGFVYGYELILRINNTRKYGFVDEERIALDYLEQIQYREASQIPIRDMNSTVEDIISSKIINNNSKQIIIYKLFCALNDNTYLTLQEKQTRVGSLLSYLCNINTGFDEELKTDVLLNIFRNKVLLEDNPNKREWVHLLLVENLLENNRFNYDDCYIRVIAEMFRALFFFINYETETLTESYRNSLQNLYLLTKEEKNLMRVSFSTLIEGNKDSIVSWLAKDAVCFDLKQNMRWDYFPRLCSAKHIIWDSASVIRFAYCYYKFVGYSRRGHPFITLVNSNEYSDEVKASVCREITNMFGGEGLDEMAQKTIEQIERLTGNKSRHYSSYDEREQVFFQKELIRLRKSVNAENKTGKGDILAQVQKNLSEYRCLLFNPKLADGRYTRYRLPPNMVETSNNQPESSAYRIAHIVCKIINDVLSRKLPKIDVGFDINGVSKLLNELEASNYRYRNYTYVNDFAFKSDVLDSEAFGKLKAIIESIQEDRNSAITSHVFLKVPQIEYYLDIQYDLVEPTDLQCEEYVRAHEIADGYYQIKGDRYDYSHAVQYVHSFYKLEIAELRVSVKVNNDTGFKLDFRR